MPKSGIEHQSGALPGGATFDDAGGPIPGSAAYVNGQRWIPGWIFRNPISSVLESLTSYLPDGSAPFAYDFTCTTLEGRGLANLVQAPSAANAFEAIIKLSDTGTDGASRYEVALTWNRHTGIGTNPAKFDTDNDGMDDGWEITYGLNPLYDDGALDKDNDELSNLQEYIHHTIPTNPDTDGDRMPDGWEVRYGLDPLSPADAPLDKDGDGLVNVDEYFYHCDPTRIDTDNDGLTDGDEVHIYHTIPTKVDTDSDGLGDGDEVNVYRTIPTKFDTDGDGMPDGWEVRYGLDPLSPADGPTDKDGDHLTNLQKYLHGTDPTNIDTDGDEMDDGWEVQYGLNPLSNDALLDKDGDELINIQEYHLHTIPNNRDTDGDGMADGWEVRYGFNPLSPADAYLDKDGDGLSNLGEYLHGSIPTNIDSDGDGLSDGAEVNRYHTDPTDADTDRDGLTDNQEVTTLRTDPLKFDSDSDGISDGDEVNRYSSNPKLIDSDGDGLSDWDELFVTHTNLNTSDSDGDGLSDREEAAVYHTNPLAWDSDGDGLSDGDEVHKYHTEPTKRDSDSDGYDDGQEVLVYYTNPLDRNDVPPGAVGFTPKIAAGSHHTLALGSSGMVWAWGSNVSGQLGDGGTEVFQQRLSQVLHLRNVKALAAGGGHSLALKADGTVWSWGSNICGQLGNGTVTDSNIPVQVLGLSNVIAIAAGESHSLALLADGTVRAWGLNTNGQLGNGTLSSVQNTPSLVIGLSNIKDIAGGSGYSLALSNGGRIYAWGDNSYGEVDSSTQNPCVLPVDLGHDSLASIAAGGYHGLAIKANQKAKAWGFNAGGQLGTGSTDISDTYGGVDPIDSEVDDYFQAKAISAARVMNGHCLAISLDGTVASWGANGAGQLGSGNLQSSLSPRLVAGVTDIVQISCGGYHSVAMRSNGTLVLWGSNTLGEQGNGTTLNQLTPTEKIDLHLLPTGEDSDQDGLPDAWEILHLGSLGQTGDNDPTGTGITNLQRYLSETSSASRNAVTENVTQDQSVPYQTGTIHFRVLVSSRDTITLKTKPTDNGTTGQISITHTYVEPLDVRYIGDLPGWGELADPSENFHSNDAVVGISPAEYLINPGFKYNNEEPLTVTIAGAAVQWQPSWKKADYIPAVGSTARQFRGGKSFDKILIPAAALPQTALKCAVVTTSSSVDGKARLSVAPDATNNWTAIFSVKNKSKSASHWIEFDFTWATSTQSADFTPNEPVPLPGLPSGDSDQDGLLDAREQRPVGQADINDSVQITALVDKVDMLWIQRDGTMYWIHPKGDSQGKLPGCRNGSQTATDPTFINDEQWFPTYPVYPADKSPHIDPTNGEADGGQSNSLASSVIAGKFPKPQSLFEALYFSADTDTTGRAGKTPIDSQQAAIKIAELPTSSNGDIIKLKFDDRYDSSVNGLHWITVNLRWKTIFTDPTKKDTDGDGLSDGQEVKLTLTDPNNPDSDGDGLSDLQEVRLGTVANAPIPASGPNFDDTNKDTDSDGLTNFEEVQYGTDPAKSDTDGDGVSDKAEITQGSDPNDPSDLYPHDQKDLALVELTVGDNSDSFSELWSLHLENLNFRAPGFGTVAKSAPEGIPEYKLQKGKSYPFQVVWVATKLPVPDYDYVANIEVKDAGAVIDDPGTILGSHLSDPPPGPDNVQYHKGQSGTLYLPKVTLRAYEAGTKANPGAELPQPLDRQSSYWGILNPNLDNDDGRSPGADGLQRVDSDDNTLGEGDNDIVKLHFELLPIGMPRGTVHINLPTGVRAFAADGSVLSSNDLTVDLTNTNGSKLRSIKTGSVDIYIEGLDGFSGGEASIEVGGEIAKVKLTPLQLAVDRNGDGQIAFSGTSTQSDQTTSSAPYRFWINNDDDTSYVNVPTVEPQDNSISQETIPPTQSDSANYSILTERNLEDFARLWINVGSLSDALIAGKLRIGLRWKSVSGPRAPGINIYQSADPAGSQNYLTESLAGYDQVHKHGTALEDLNSNKLVSSTATFILPKQTWEGDIDSGPIKHFLFEGNYKGNGQLQVVLVTASGNEIQGGGVWLKLLDVREMYERAKVNRRGAPVEAPDIKDAWKPGPDDQLGWTSDPYQWQPDIDPNATASTIVYVHGWRMTYEEVLNWSSTTLKRLWQRGFRGRFFSFRWPTYDGYNDGLDFSDLNLIPEIPQGALSYNPSEYRAWLSGPALANYVNQLPNPNRRFLIAHSMGNVVACSAFQDAQTRMTVTGYAMCNSAMAGMSYNSLIQDVDNVTPDTSDANTQAAFGLGNLMANPGTSITSFYLPPDNALGSWYGNNQFFKPQPFANYKYRYIPDNANGSKLEYGHYVQTSQDADQPLEWASVKEIMSRPEAMGYVTQARSHAAGSYAVIGNAVKHTIPMGDGSGYGFSDVHSAEWEFTMRQTYRFWDDVILQFGE